MTVRTDGPIIPEALAKVCADILQRNGIEPFGDRALHWLMPPELIERYMSRDLKSRLFGYPVHMEFLLGESSIILMETIASARVTDD